MNFEKIERAGHVLYMCLDSLPDPSVATAIGALALADLAARAGMRYNLGGYRRISLFVDEVSNVINQPLIEILNKGAEGGIFTTCAMQTLADLAKRLGSEAAARMALGNLNNLIALRSKDRPTQDFVVETFGKTAIHSVRVGLEPFEAVVHRVGGPEQEEASQRFRGQVSKPVAGHHGGYWLADGIRNVSRERRCAPKAELPTPATATVCTLLANAAANSSIDAQTLELPRTGGRHAKDGTFGSQPRTQGDGFAVRHDAQVIREPVEHGVGCRRPQRIKPISFQAETGRAFASGTRCMRAICMDSRTCNELCITHPPSEATRRPAKSKWRAAGRICRRGTPKTDDHRRRGSRDAPLALQTSSDGRFGAAIQ